MRHRKLGVLTAVVVLLAVQAACNPSLTGAPGRGPTPTNAATREPVQTRAFLPSLEPTTTPPPQPTPIPTTALRFTSYQNSYYGYEISYPAWWTNSTHDWPYQPTQIFRGSELGVMTIDVLGNPDRLALAEWIGVYAPCNLPRGSLSDKKTVLVDGVQGLHFLWHSSDYGNYDVVFLGRDEYVYLLQLERTSLLGPILETWHFSEPAILLPSAARGIVADRAQEVIEAIADRDFETLADFVHPEQGLLFSPYAYINEHDLVFSAAKVRQLGTDRTAYLWGGYDGSGESIQLAFAEYYDRFIYSRDFAALPAGYNQLLGRGNTAANHFAAFPDAIAVEYHYSGSDSRCDEMSWESLLLIFQEREGMWYLVAIVHAEWTI